jgi:hypothetical protein
MGNFSPYGALVQAFVPRGAVSVAFLFHKRHYIAALYPAMSKTALYLQLADEFRAKIRRG